MSNDGSGYRPSAGERLAQDFAAKKLGEVLNGHGATVPVDWNRLGNPAAADAVSGDRSGVDDPMTLEDAARADGMLGALVPGTVVTPQDYQALTVLRKWFAQYLLVTVRKRNLDTVLRAFEGRE